MANAGKITIDVTGPYPVWCALSHSDFEGVRINLHHKELSDLKYAVEKAMQEAEHNLTKSPGWNEHGEVYP